MNDSDERAKSEKNAHISEWLFIYFFFHILFGGVDFIIINIFFLSCVLVGKKVSSSS